MHVVCLCALRECFTSLFSLSLSPSLFHFLSHTHTHTQTHTHTHTSQPTYKQPTYKHAYLSGDGDGGVDRVGDNAEDRFGARLGASGHKVAHDGAVGVEQVVTGPKKKILEVRALLFIYCMNPLWSFDF